MTAWTSPSSSFSPLTTRGWETWTECLQAKKEHTGLHVLCKYGSLQATKMAVLKAKHMQT